MLITNNKNNNNEKYVGTIKETFFDNNYKLNVHHSFDKLLKKKVCKILFYLHIMLWYEYTVGLISLLAYSLKQITFSLNGDHGNIIDTIKKITKLQNIR